MTQYRRLLYGNYHSTQSGRAAGTDARSLFEREKLQFKREIIPQLQTIRPGGAYWIWAVVRVRCLLLCTNPATNTVQVLM